jgi:hypothetical protein
MGKVGSDLILDHRSTNGRHGKNQDFPVSFQLAASALTAAIHRDRKAIEPRR